LTIRLVLNAVVQRRINHRAPVIDGRDPGARRGFVRPACYEVF
jgi:hypothetical protein